MGLGTKRENVWNCRIVVDVEAGRVNTSHLTFRDQFDEPKVGVEGHQQDTIQRVHHHV